MNIEEAAKYLGCTKGALWARLHKGVMPRSLTRKVGARVYFDIADLNGWLKAQTREDRK